MYFPKPSLNENDLAIIERGDTAAHSIEAGRYVSWHGKTGKAKTAILQGATLSESLFDYDEDGVLPQFTTVAVRTPSSVNFQTKYSLPDGYDKTNSYIVGVKLKYASDGVYCQDPRFVAQFMQDGICVYAAGSEFVSKDVDVLLMKYK